MGSVSSVSRVLLQVCLVCLESYYNDAGLPPAHGRGYKVYTIPMKGASLTNEKCVTQLLVHMFL